MAELQNQDPTNPKESKDYLAQLATFSSVEQSIQTNSKLDQILAAMSTNDATGLIGRSVTTADGAASGTVVSVRLIENGLLARLDDGTEIPIGPGVSIS